MGASAPRTRFDWTRWLVIWTCIIVNTGSLVLLVLGEVSRLMIIVIFLVSLIPYLLYIRYRTPPV